MGIADQTKGLTTFQAFQKRTFDLTLAAIGILLTWWLMLIAFVLACMDARGNGLFVQERIGRHGKRFMVMKLRTMRSVEGIHTTVTTGLDPRITRVGQLLRRTKLDELPQFFNVLFGDMSFVGPRPDVPGYADSLTGENRIVLSVRPGITGPATLKYRNEEEILARQSDPEAYNWQVIYPDKVRINRDYIRNWRLRDDIRYILLTVIGR